MAFSAGDAPRLTTGSCSNLEVWDLASSQRLARRRLPAGVWRHFRAGDGRIFSLSHKGSVQVWNDRLLAEDAHHIRYDHAASEAAISPGHGLLAIGQKNGRVVFWDTVARKPAGVLKAAGGAIGSLAFAPFENKLCVVSTDETNRVLAIAWAR